MSIYSLFYKKLPSCKEDVLPSSKGKVITFLNPYYLEKVKSYTKLYEKFDYICSDGFLPIFLNKLWGCAKSMRISFDMTSLAKDIFAQNPNNVFYSIYFIGSTQENIENFIAIIRNTYPNIDICGFHHGYINDFNDVGKKVMMSNADIILIGMGAPLQDKFAIYIKEQGFKGTVYTCGGFFHQTVKTINYYPHWINKLNLRALYRMIREPYVIKRVLKYYPLFVIKYSFFLVKMKSQKRCIK